MNGERLNNAMQNTISKVTTLKICMCCIVLWAHHSVAVFLSAPVEFATHILILSTSEFLRSYSLSLK